MQPSYNLYMQILTNLMELKSTTNWLWVKAHQEGKSSEIWINKLADEHANSEREAIRDPEENFPLPSTKIELMVNQVPITSKYKKIIQYEYTHDQQKNMEEKKGWTTSINQQIQWPTLRNAIKHFPIAIQIII